MSRKEYGFCEQVGGNVVDIMTSLRGFVTFVGVTASAVVEAVRNPHKIRWNDTIRYMVSCGVDALPVTLLLCYLTGVILGYQAALQMKKYGADALLPALVGCAVVRELGPLMTAIVVTGRSGSAFAAEIGTMKINEELDAMKVMGLSILRFLITPKLIAMLLMIPLLTILGDIVGILGGYTVGCAELGLSSTAYLNITREWVLPKYCIEGIIKSVVFAYIITTVGCWRGFETGDDALAVGRSTTRSVVISILLIVVADAVMAKIAAMIFGMES